MKGIFFKIILSIICLFCFQIDAKIGIQKVKIEDLGGFDLKKALVEIYDSIKLKNELEKLPEAFFHCYNAVMAGETEISLDDLAEIIPLLTDWAMPEVLDDEGIKYKKFGWDVFEEGGVEKVLDMLKILKARLEIAEDKSTVLNFLEDNKAVAQLLRIVILVLSSMEKDFKDMKNEVKDLRSSMDDLKRTLKDLQK